mmetsp:Transcript_2349/g.3369  ORF Transcript_2349/g.3369 Transcript_2349/m.3369 type:complete len:383 (-) Transcript_2349:284-1432(-)|eukprot:CAMPEP_0171461160 /NCGR_PEP_ID=MMETSP0945-20130129/5724_1 /TAXON_ID=109269 /ORGANISM="Vaucheria litorea, Strain CCMP2940" /LENGTH=382 /DNA_ID=CAMNT_0011987461 /DNA_START=113 /DNA_END=1261 /DNA_ORIENTATION=-
MISEIETDSSKALNNLKLSKESKRLSGSMKKATKVGNYVLVKTIGKGSSGKVKLAQDIVNNEHVAIKVISKKWIEERKKEGDVAREIDLMSPLKHNNVVELKDVMNGKSAIYLVMEYVNGMELFDVIALNRTLDEPTAKSYFSQLVEGLNYLHFQGIAHRDIKPENILISNDGKLKIADFGLSVNCGSGKVAMCGTPHYTAPEVFADCESSKTYDPRSSDVWSAGIVLYMMLAGCHPFEAATPIEALNLISTSEVEFPSHFSESVRNLLSKIFIKDPKQRISLEDVICHSWLNEGELSPLKSTDSLRETLPSKADNFKMKNPFFSDVQGKVSLDLFSPMSSFSSLTLSPSTCSTSSSMNSSPHCWLATPSKDNESVPPSQKN